MKKEIEYLLFESGVSNYQISKATGISQPVLHKYSTGKSDVENMTFGNAIKLYDYYQKLREDGKLMRVWQRDGYKVVEIDFDHDLHALKVVKDSGQVVATITPASIDDMESIIEDLDAGEDVDGWEDGRGNTIRI